MQHTTSPPAVFQCVCVCVCVWLAAAAAAAAASAPPYDELRSLYSAGVRPPHLRSAHLTYLPAAVVSKLALARPAHDALFILVNTECLSVCLVAGTARCVYIYNTASEWTRRRPRVSHLSAADIAAYRIIIISSSTGRYQ